LHNEIDSPIAVCERIAEGIERQSCFTGVFMENADLISTHNTLVGTTKVQVRDATNLRYPCDAVPHEARHACLRYQPRVQTSVFDETGVTETAKRREARIQACESFSGKDRADCFEGIGFNSYTLIQTDPGTAHRFCDNLELATDRAACMLGMTFWAANFGQIHESLSFCEPVAGEYERNICYHGVFETIIEGNGVLPGSAAKYCETHDSPLCLAGLEAYQANPWSQLFGLPVADE
jgi:hypothetical protein